MNLFWDSPGEVQGSKISNDYSLPPTLKCINRKAFLPIPDPWMPFQDYREGQPQKTLAYAQALKYWAEKANLPKPDELHLLVRCIHELRWAMRPFTTFTDGAIFRGTTMRLGILEEGATEPSMTETTQTPMLERRPPTSPGEPATLPAEESDVSATAPGEPTAELTSGLAASSTPPGTDKKVRESPPCELPSWTQIHSSHLVTPVGQVPLSLGDMRQCHQSHSSSRRRAQHCPMEKQRKVDRETLVQLHCASALCLTPLWKIHWKCHHVALGDCSIFDKGSTPMNHHWGSPGVDATQSVGHAMTMLTSTRINQHETTGITHMDMVTASIGLVALEMSHMMVDPNMPTLKGGPGQEYCHHRCHWSMKGGWLP